MRLEHALCSSHPLPALNGEPFGASPSFYWQTSRNEAPKLLHENPWLASVPCLLLETPQPGHPSLGADTASASKIHRTCLDLFVRRYQAMNRRRTYSCDSRLYRPVLGFLKAAQHWQVHAGADPGVSVRNVAELALKFAMLFAVLDGKPEPDMAAVNFGLALAKRLTIRHHQTLSALLPVETEHLPDTFELSDRERKVFLRICERPGITLAEISRSFNRLCKDERDQAVVKLVGRGLVRMEDGRLWQTKL